MALFTHLPGAGGELKQAEDCDDAWETVPESTDLREDCCHLVKATRGDSSQLQAHLVFPSAYPPEASSTRPVGAKLWSLAKGVQSPSYAISLQICCSA